MRRGARASSKNSTHDTSTCGASLPAPIGKLANSYRFGGAIARGLEYDDCRPAGVAGWQWKVYGMAAGQINGVAWPGSEEVPNGGRAE